MDLMPMTGLVAAGPPPPGDLAWAAAGVLPVAIPVYAAPRETAPIRAGLPAAVPLPHFQATTDLGWAEVMLPDGSFGWVRMQPARLRLIPAGAGLPIVLDPGHGGPTDPGAQVGALVERDLNLDLALRLAPRLEADPGLALLGVRVYLTRTDNTTPLALAFRTAVAAAAEAAAIVSLHLNSHPDPAVLGTESFYKCGSESTPAEREAGHRLACTLHRRILDHWANWGTCPTADRGVICRLIAAEEPRSLYFVLREGPPQQPAALAAGPSPPRARAAVLLEPGYLTNAGQAACLNDPAFRAGLAESVYQGLREWVLTGGDPACPTRTEFGR